MSAAGIATDPEKVAAVERWPRPETLKQLRSFMGFASYYRRYVPRFTAIASPLNALITTCCRDIKGKRRSSASFKLASRWNEKCEEAFSAIKLELTSAPVLGFADYGLPFIVETDASELGLGAVLSQIQDGKIRIIAYASRGLHKSEKNKSNYSSKKLELLALKWAVSDKFRDYLLGGEFILYTDNNPLTYLMRSSKLPAVEQRWAAALAAFNFEIKYRSAKHNANADALSRLTPAAMVSSDVDSCFEELTRTTKLPEEIHVNVVEAREHAPAIVGDSIGTLPSISPVDMRELQKSDDGLQRVIWYRHRGRHRDMRERSEKPKARHDRHAHELPLAAGERVYLRKHGVLGRNKIQYVWQPTPYRVVMRQGMNDVYVVEPADGFGEQRTVNRAALRLCVPGNTPTAAQPARRRRLPCPPSVTSAGSDDTSDTSSAPLLWTVRDQVDCEEASSASPVSDSSSTSDNEEVDVRPVTLRRTCRTRAGTHTNPGNWPRSAKR